MLGVRLNLECRDETDFGWRHIRDNVCLLKPATIERISHLIVAEGHRLQPDAAKQTRADSFVVETNIHWPAESRLIRDGVRKIIELCILLANTMKAGCRAVVVPQTRIVQNRLNGATENAAFDRGFHTPENQQQLAAIVANPCLPKPGAKRAAEQSRTATMAFFAKQVTATPASSPPMLPVGNSSRVQHDMFVATLVTTRL